ncbi:MAG: hypothetical protein KAG61_04165 [Bacteriovoracaceae bacterium]|nr:hypothetical protein [Bacteriovoracaceae bacterium]
MKNIILLTFLILMTSTVFADVPAPDEASSKMIEACSKDFKQFCPNIKKSSPMAACIKRNTKDFSPKCIASLIELNMIVKKPSK